MTATTLHISADFFLPFVPDDSIVLALSGGADSVALGTMLSRCAFRRVVVAHFEHGLRGKESREDQEFCSKTARHWGWEFATERWKSPQKSEEKSRNARYLFLERVRKKYKAKAIFLAHHQDDQAETVLFQFLRGTGIRGLGGMKKWDPNRKLFRPLLETPKAELLNFLQREKISFRTDSTNDDPENFDRNFLRLKVLPLLKKRFPHWEKTLSRNAFLFQQLAEFWQKEEEAVWEQLSQKDSKGQISFPRPEFLALPEFMQGALLKKVYAPKELSFDQAQELLIFFKNAVSGKKKSLLGKNFLVYGKNVFLD